MIHHQTTVMFMVRGDTGVELDIIKDRLTSLSDGESVAWGRYQMLGGGEILVTRDGDRFRVSGETRV